VNGLGNLVHAMNCGMWYELFDSFVWIRKVHQVSPAHGCQETWGHGPAKQSMVAESTNPPKFLDVLIKSSIACDQENQMGS
jgi:hypothetical protein